ncbi:MAG TPA: D-alanine--D-alanine ligase [Candidatus Limnocylindria bacterium]|nr:D-alanine--D-alanine ligase [Candidatus Limnocylindria bacterium]
MPKTEVVVLGGGNSPEREVSLRSAIAVAKAARAAGFTVQEYDPADGLDFLDALSKDAVVLPILHGKGGEDGVVQEELEKRGLQYLGADSAASVLCFDKGLTRQRLQEHDVPVAGGMVVTRDEYSHQPLAKRPHILKVSRGGSSIGTLFIRDPKVVDQGQVDEIFRLDDQAILEELVGGVEITVAVLGQKALPVIEIQPPETGEFDYENKYNGQTLELCPPQHVSQVTQLAAQKLAEKVHTVTGCRHLSRVDMIVRPDDSLVVLEINTIPGMTDQSLFPKSAQAAGIDMPELVQKFVKMVQRDG